MWILDPHLHKILDTLLRRGVNTGITLFRNGWAQLSFVKRIRIPPPLRSFLQASLAAITAFRFAEKFHAIPAT